MTCVRVTGDIAGAGVGVELKACVAVMEGALAAGAGLPKAERYAAFAPAGEVGGFVRQAAAPEAPAQAAVPNGETAALAAPAGAPAAVGMPAGGAGGTSAQPAAQNSVQARATTNVVRNTNTSLRAPIAWMATTIIREDQKVASGIDR
jgi:hypothetical protein